MKAQNLMFFSYQIVFLLLTYLAPIMLMITWYTIMGRQLWRAKSIGEITQRQLDSIKAKRRVSII